MSKCNIEILAIIIWSWSDHMICYSWLYVSYNQQLLGATDTTLWVLHVHGTVIILFVSYLWYISSAL